MSDIEVLEAMAREAGLRLESARRSLEDAQARYDAASEAYGRACSEMGAAIERANP